MSATVADDMIRSYFERWQRLEDEKRTISDDLKELFAEARGNGLDTKALRAVFREQVGDKAAAQEFDAICDLYRASLNAPRAGRARETTSYAEAKGVEPRGFIASLSDEQKAAALAYRGDETHGGELTDTQEQPETDEPCDCSERVKPGEYYHCPKCDTEWFPEEDNSPSPETPQAIADEEASPPAASSATLSNPQPSSPGAVKAPEADSSPASGATLSEADVPAFLRTERRKTSADYRPHCKHPDNCGSSNPTGYCYQCRRDMKAASETEAA